MITPILVIGYARPELLGQTLAVVKANASVPVFINIDHPKKPAHAPRVEETAAVAEQFSREYQHGCVVRKLPVNHGSVRAIPSSVSWVLEQHDTVIVLEDDCLPHPTFFPFCNELLERYRDDGRVFMISGNNFLPAEMQRKWPASYHFSRYTNTWGWATWKRAWKYFDATLSRVDCPEYELIKNGAFYHGTMDLFWSQRTKLQKADPHDSCWDARWLFNTSMQHGISIVPRVNLIRNIGFGPHASHTTRNYGYFIKPRQRMPMPLVHPTIMSTWYDADRWWFDHLISKSPWSRIRRFSWRVDPATIVDEP
jgi:hypothetical protein